jgi:hypothetical protein
MKKKHIQFDLGRKAYKIYQMASFVPIPVVEFFEFAIVKILSYPQQSNAYFKKFTFYSFKFEKKVLLFSDRSKLFLDFYF